jgi:hypothetical protein
MIQLINKNMNLAKAFILTINFYIAAKATDIFKKSNPRKPGGGLSQIFPCLI